MTERQIRLTAVPVEGATVGSRASAGRGWSEPQIHRYCHEECEEKLTDIEREVNRTIFTDIFESHFDDFTNSPFINVVHREAFDV